MGPFRALRQVREMTFRGGLRPLWVGVEHVALRARRSAIFAADPITNAGCDEESDELGELHYGISCNS